MLLSEVTLFTTCSQYSSLRLKVYLALRETADFSEYEDTDEALRKIKVSQARNVHTQVTPPKMETSVS